MTRLFSSQVKSVLFVYLVLVAIITACGGKSADFDPETFDPLTNVPAEMSVKSPEFREGEAIPIRFTCDGENTPPNVSWEKPPSGTEAVVLIMDNPDAPKGIFSHWVIFNIPSADNSVRSVIEGKASNGVVLGVNGFGKNEYGGPCPPAEETHEYRFNVFALIAPLELDETATMNDVLAAMRGTVVGHGVLGAVYSRP
jgi:Raf kinase inhibitor-like YbhB/YbcL family protein